jgi:periplasmic copper chaperone A
LRNLILFFCILLLFGLFACTRDEASPITVRDAWARPAIMDDGAGSGGNDGMEMDSDGPISAAFMVIRNRKDTPDRLLSAESTAASVLEIHLTEVNDNVMTMRPVEGGLEIPANGQVELKPGSYHIMLIDVQQDLKVGEKIPITLLFENAGEIRVEAEIMNP